MEHGPYILDDTEQVPSTKYSVCSTPDGPLHRPLPMRLLGPVYTGRRAVRPPRITTTRRAVSLYQSR